MPSRGVDGGGAADRPPVPEGLLSVTRRPWSRRTKLVAIAVAVAVVAAGCWLAGRALDDPLLAFVGSMIGATTFVPLPADTFVLNASAHLQPVTIGVVGGLLNATMVLIERRWLLIFVDHPAFARFAEFFHQNRLVALTSRNMFLGLLVGGASFIPFEPFRLIAVMADYSPVRYAIATFIARGGRYYVLALVGSALLQVGFLQQAIWLTLILFFFGLWRSAVRLFRRPGAGQDGDGEGAADSDGRDIDPDERDIDPDEEAEIAR